MQKWFDDDDEMMGDKEGLRSVICRFTLCCGDMAQKEKKNPKCNGAIKDDNAEKNQFNSVTAGLLLLECIFSSIPSFWL